MGDWGENVFPILGVKVPKSPWLWPECFQRTKKWTLLRTSSQIFQKWLKIAHFCYFCHVLVKTCQKFHFRCAKFLKNARFPLPFHIIYGKKGPRFFVCSLFGLLLRCFCFVCVVISASDGSNAKRSAKFFKMAKANHIKIFIFRKHFSRSLINIYDLICSCLGISIFFTFLLSF